MPDHISYPSPSTPPEIIPKSSAKDRVFIGNLSPTVDEYTLIQVLAKHGSIKHLDFLFHRSGPQKGKPRGYAFVEFAKPDDATKAIAELHDRPLRGRNLVLNYANQVAPDVSANGSVVRRRTIMESGHPTALSMMKEKTVRRSGNKTEDKIARMEAKLRQMEAAKAAGPPPESLPPKPDFIAPIPDSDGPQSRPIFIPVTHPPVLPTPVLSYPKTKPGDKKKAKLAGVKIVKKANP
ncbi:hypothetical protein CYLTODRAFT_376684 [Cylindrobasidium torrendii FP15055 ss-10]|uniref:Probable RNA-binding protein 18 n=1 Tax=Cylindrobasidium torrendii FP15055 ss-10 TaxID=1314674 RepID=A0A0D7B9C2_9AGAR|nr:hypothetical protein CYLTODRAFT_376684 [Cylindrobasidium torrendii FP15055 ss-10]